MSIHDNYLHIVDQITHTAKACGRNPEDIMLISVSKTFPVAAIKEALADNITIFGENKVQEATQKFTAINGNFSVHLIGHLQSNKAKDAVRLFDVIHSIDKLSTAEKVEKEAQKIDKKQKILIQVNTSGEHTKNGVSPDETADFCQAVSCLSHVELCGLMTIGPFTNDIHLIRESFSRLRELRDSINNLHRLDLKELSMGMSSDYTIAIEEGATMLRIGSAIFGQRDYR